MPTVEDDEFEDPGLGVINVLEPLEDLDDVEFGLPPVENPPSLEEILAEDGDLLRTIDDFEDDCTASGFLVVESHLPSLSNALLQLGLDGSTSDATSIHSRLSDARSRVSNSLNKHKKFDKSKVKNGSIMRHVVLKGISAQLVSARDRVDAGLPTVMAASSFASQVAVGTSHGFILVFDGHQKLRFSLGGTVYGREHGSVSALAFDRADSITEPPSRLLVGFSKGQLLEFDIVAGKLLRTLDEVHPPGSAVLHVRFTDDHSLAIMSNSGGSVFEISFTRTLGIRGYNSKCIFSGCRGEVCTLEPLSLSSQYPNHPLSDRTIVALATISKVIVLTLRPRLKVQFSYSLTGKSSSLPLLSWQCVVIQTSNAHKVVDPVLAFGRQDTIYFFQLSENLSGKIVFTPLQSLRVPYNLISFGWMNARCLATLDSEEHFHLYDVKNQENLESLDLSIVQLCYGSSFFKGLATGGNVSEAMSIAGETSIYGSFITVANQLLLLGRNTFHVLVIRSWTERLDHLVKNNQYVDCIGMALEFYQDVSKALVGIKGTRERRKQMVANRLVAVLLKHLDVSMNKNFPPEGDVQTLTDYFNYIVPPCIEACMTIRRQDILFEQVWNTYSQDPFAKASYLDNLESYILSDQLRDLPVAICQEYVSLFENTGRFVALEASITHLNVTSLDFHQIMNVCNTHGLYDAIIYLYNNGLQDFVTPFEDLIGILLEAMKTQVQLKPDQIRLGNKLLVYISCCLAGRAYPYGDIPKDKVAKVKYDINACVTTLHTKRPKEDEPFYPYLRALLSFDTQGLLNVISIAFEEAEFNTELGRCQKQRLVDILLKIMVEGGDYSPGQVAFFFTFLARQIAKGDNCLTISRELFDQVLTVLTSSSDHSHHEEREQALLDMLHAGGMAFFDREHLISCASRAGFYRILEILYESQNEYDKILRCYIDDPMRNLQSFVFIQKAFLESELSLAATDKKSAVEKSVLKDLFSLIAIDAKKTASVIYYHMYPFIPLVVDKLEGDEKELFQFLKITIEYRENGSQPASPIKTMSDTKKEDILSSPETYELFICLMCKFEPQCVSAYLKARTSRYDNQRTLKICQKYHLIDAQAFLLEEEGSLNEAFELLSSELKAKISKVIDVNPQDDNELLWIHVNTSIVSVIQFCQRVSSRSTDPRSREKFWFDLLDSIMVPQRSSSKDKKQFKDAIRHVINSAMGCVNLRDLIEKIVQDPVYLSEESFGEIRDFLLEMLQMYHYEETLMKSTCRSVRVDMFEQLQKQQSTSKKGLSVRKLQCNLCRQHLAKQMDSIAFQCGHSYHMSCLERSGCLFLSKPDQDSHQPADEQWHCYSCVTINHPTNLKHKANPEQLRFSATGENTREEIISAITNQRISRAINYISLMKTKTSHLHAIEPTTGLQTAANKPTSKPLNGSIFDSPEFKLQLAPHCPE